MNGQLLNQFVAIVGETYALTEKNDITPFVEDARGRFKATSPLVLRPENVNQVSQILKLANQTNTAIIPQGGNTGLVGGGFPLSNGGNDEVILSLSRMNRVLAVDVKTNTMTVESGAILETLQNAADNADRLFPLSLGSQGSCQIGGNISTNAGGTGVLAYGNTRELVMGLEVVLADGEIWNGLSRLRKDNTGYDLKNLFIGAEGTLGVITKAVLKLFPKPAGREVSYVALKTPEDALELLNRAKDKAGSALTGFELMAPFAMEFALKHMPDSRAPLQGEHPWYVLMEISSNRSTSDAREILENILEQAFETGLVQDATLAENLAQQKTFWKLREDMSDAQKPEGASIKHDIAVPVGEVPQFIKLADAAVLKIVPGARIINFGHMGDGNLHYNISQPVGWEGKRFFAHEKAIHDAVYEIVEQLNGSFSAEHGIGQLKRERLEARKDPTALAMMRTIKQALDPKGIMNPGKVLR